MLKKDTKIEIKQVDLKEYNFEEYEENSFDGMLTDAPYELGFMNRSWDKSGIAFDKEFWRKTFRILKPGAYALVFGGSRTHHRLMVALEDAGFIIRDVLFYVYGSGFPKSYNISKGIDKKFGEEREVIGKSNKGASNKSHQTIFSDDSYDWKKEINITKPASKEAEQWDGYGTALKPSYEPIILVQKPIEGNYVNNALKYGVGGLNIDGCRIEAGEEITNRVSKGGGTQGLCTMGDLKEIQYHGHKQGRFPANLIIDDSQEVEDLFPESKSGRLNNTIAKAHNGFQGKAFKIKERKLVDREASQGSASRFFYTAKASKKEKEAGLENLELNKSKFVAGNYSQSPVCKTCGKTLNGINDHSRCSGEVYYREMDSTNTIKNIHPTVKPLSLTSYISKLILPPKRENDNRKLLVPFSGSGSEIIGAMMSGWDEIYGFEVEEDYIKIAEARIEYWRSHNLETYQKQINKSKSKDKEKSSKKENSWIK